MKVTDFNRNDIQMYFRGGLIPAEVDGNMVVGEAVGIVEDVEWYIDDDNEERQRPHPDAGKFIIHERETGTQHRVDLNNVAWEGNLPNRVVYSQGLQGVVFLGPRGYRTVCKIFSRRTIGGLSFSTEERRPRSITEGSRRAADNREIQQYILGVEPVANKNAASVSLEQRGAAIVGDNTAIIKMHEGLLMWEPEGERDPYRVVHESLCYGYFPTLSTAWNKARRLMA